MFKIKSIQVTAGKQFTIWNVSKKRAMNLGELMGPEGQEYIVYIHGKGAFHLKDMGTYDASQSAGQFCVRINNSKLWRYNNEGEMNIDCGVDGQLAANFTGGVYPVICVAAEIGGTLLSNISAPKYGYDFVVATTQESINVTMKDFLDRQTFTPTEMYYVYNDRDEAIEIPKADLLKLTKGTDPLTVPAFGGTGAKSQDLVNLDDALFAYAFKATAGIPEDMPLLSIPDLVTLRPGAQQVEYKMICKEFQIVERGYTPTGKLRYTNIKQDDTDPWMFTSYVDLIKMFATNDLPPDVKKKYDELIRQFGPNAFSIEQLIMDFTNAIGATSPKFDNKLPENSPVPSLLDRMFLKKYIAAMKEKMIPVLNYNVAANTNIPPASLIMTDMKFGVSPFLEPWTDTADIPRLNTLNYLCGIDNKKVPGPVAFDWNWVEMADEIDFDGVISINRNNFITFLNKTLSQRLDDLDIITTVWMTHDGLTLYVRWSHSHGTKTGQTFTVVPAASPDAEGFTKLLTYELNNPCYTNTEDSIGLGRMNGDFDYHTKVDISCKNNLLRVTTHSWSWLRFEIKTPGISWAEIKGNIADFTSVVDYELFVKTDGSMGAKRIAKPLVDNSQQLDISGWDKFLAGSIMDAATTTSAAIKQAVEDSIADFSNDIEAAFNGYQHFVFPGGRTFSFKDVRFSKYQDLVSHIKYVDPVKTKKYSSNHRIATIETTKEEVKPTVKQQKATI